MVSSIKPLEKFSFDDIPGFNPGITLIKLFNQKKYANVMGKLCRRIVELEEQNNIFRAKRNTDATLILSLQKELDEYKYNQQALEDSKLKTYRDLLADLERERAISSNYRNLNIKLKKDKESSIAVNDLLRKEIRLLRNDLNKLIEKSNIEEPEKMIIESQSNTIERYESLLSKLARKE